MLFLSALVSAVGEGALPFEDDNIPLDSLEHKRVPISCDGDNTGDKFAAAKLVWIGPTLFDKGDTRRESVFRDIVSRFEGDGSVDTSIVSSRSLVDPSESGSLA